VRQVRSTLAVVAVFAASLMVPAAVAAVQPSVDWDQVLKGNSGNNTIRGDSGRDKILGLGGNDTLNGLAGRDRLQGGPGNDTLGGGNGRDKLFGGQGRDRLNGGAGNDLLVGAGGRDRLFGGPGNDTLRADGDNRRDFVDCGVGTNDRAFVDARDVVTRCETVTVTGQ
jgi:Ca2+-binding RTX toxin-like protein